MQYGFVTWAIALYTGGELYATPKWDTIAKAGSAAWLEDSTNNVHASINGIPFVENYLLNGTDKGDTTLAIGSGALTADQASLSGTSTGTGSESGLTATYSAQLDANVYVTYKPTIPAIIRTPLVIVPVLLEGNLT